MFVACNPIILHGVMVYIKGKEEPVKVMLLPSASQSKPSGINMAAIMAYRQKGNVSLQQLIGTAYRSRKLSVTIASPGPLPYHLRPSLGCD